VLDHVAVAVGDPDVAEARYRDVLGGGRVSAGDLGVFATRQLRFTGGGKLELLSPSPSGRRGFVQGFLARFGAAIHHLTLRVPDLGEAIATVTAARLDVVDVQDTDGWWQEAFLRPSQIGGLIVQLAWSRGGDAEWAARMGYEPTPPRADAARLLGPTIRHPDLDRAAGLWSLLGARIEPHADTLRCTWPDSPLDVVIEAGEPAGPVALRIEGGPELPADATLGPAVRACVPEPR
jgi:catechol 2,3-dioxygenase-like lactoylglutathione lyase family enzyme